MSNTHQTTENIRLLTCILYKGGGVNVLKALHAQGINRTSLWHARGSAIGDPVGKNGLPTSFEKEIVTAVIPAAQTEEIFDSIFEIADIDRPYGGFFFIEKLKYATAYELQNIPEEDPAT
jgi:hypothetical protein